MKDNNIYLFARWTEGNDDNLLKEAVVGITHESEHERCASMVIVYQTPEAKINGLNSLIRDLEEMKKEMLE